MMENFEKKKDSEVNCKAKIEYGSRREMTCMKVGVE
jgi:hypothetical protein